MIGAMPAVAVRHERRKQEKRKRPSQLYLGGLVLRHSPPSRATSPTPSPLQSPAERRDNHQEYYLFGKFSLLHMVVVSLLLGAILLIVGLVQLKPGADASQHRYYLMAIGSFLMLAGILLAAVRCCLLPWRMRERERRERRERRESVAHLENGRRPSDVRSEKVVHSPVVISLKETLPEVEATAQGDPRNGVGVPSVNVVSVA